MCENQEALAALPRGMKLASDAGEGSDLASI